MNMNRALSMLLLSTLSAGASAALVTVDAGNYSFSYDNRFWGTSAFSQSGNTFSFSNLSSALGTQTSGFLNHPEGGIQKFYYARGSDSPFSSIRIKADNGFRLSSLTTGVTGSMLAASSYDAANLDGNYAHSDMLAHIVWKDAAGTRGQALIEHSADARRNAAGVLTNTGSSGPYDLSHTSIFGRDVYNVAGDFNAEGDIWLGGKGVSATSSIDTAYFNIAVVPIPEPETWALFMAGLGVLGAVARRRRRTI